MYQLDHQAAREADTFGAYLSETGKYIGTFTRAEKLISNKKGTHGIGFTFECSGQTTRFDIWTMDAQNQHLSGFKALNAIMTCLGMKSIAPRPGKVEKKNWETNQTEVVDAEVFPGLMGKQIGLALQKTEYEKIRDGHKTGETGWRLELVAPFRAADEFTASEILDHKTEPKKLTAIVSRLADRPLKSRPVQNERQPQSSSSSGFDDMTDDIPF